ncbi:MAG: hypothetical protein HQL32_10955 [Planctomycetes bacterium]|nr:hypothetical protein [Planctomycetota bacterium]
MIEISDSKIRLSEGCRLQLLKNNTDEQNTSILIKSGSLHLSRNKGATTAWTITTPSSRLEGDIGEAYFEIQDELSIVTLLDGKGKVQSMDHFNQANGQALTIKDNQQSRIQMFHIPSNPRPLKSYEKAYFREHLMLRSEDGQFTLPELIEGDSAGIMKKVLSENEQERNRFATLKQAAKLTKEESQKLREGTRDHLLKSVHEDIQQEGSFSWPLPLPHPDETR